MVHKKNLSKSLSSLFKKSDVSDSSKSLSKNELFDWKNSYFHMFFTAFSLLWTRANHPLSSLLRWAFLKRDGSNSLLSLFTKEGPWANCSRHSLQKSDRERFAPVALSKKATRSIHSFSRVKRSFTHKKQEVCLKNQKSKFPTLNLTAPFKKNLQKI